MKLSKEQVQVLKSILQETCSEDKVVKRADIFREFEKKTQSNIEKYQFEKDLSELIRKEKISGYTIKVGRGGGIIKTEPIERISITCSSGKYIGCIPASKLSTILESLQRS